MKDPDSGAHISGRRDWAVDKLLRWDLLLRVVHVHLLVYYPYSIISSSVHLLHYLYQYIFIGMNILIYINPFIEKNE